MQLTFRHEACVQSFCSFLRSQQLAAPLCTSQHHRLGQLLLDTYRVQRTSAAVRRAAAPALAQSSAQLDPQVQASPKLLFLVSTLSTGD